MPIRPHSRPPQISSSTVNGTSRAVSPDSLWAHRITGTPERRRRWKRAIDSLPSRPKKLGS